MWGFRLLALAAVVCAGCGRRGNADFANLSEEFVYTSLSFSPSNATSAGLHQHGGRKLDELLDDYSPAAIDRQRAFYHRFRARVEAAQPAGGEDRADAEIMRDQCGLALLELDDIQNWRHNPTLYVEIVGNALFSPYVLDYAPHPDRMRHIVARLQRLPGFLRQAEANLVSSSPVWTTVAAEENAGNIRLVETTLPAAMPPGMRAAYDRAARPALRSLRNFQNFLTGALAARGPWEWRLGKDKYLRKFGYALAAGVQPEEMLSEAETDLRATRERMLDLSRGILKRTQGDMNQTIAAALDQVASKHPTREGYVAQARADLDEARRFVEQKQLLTLPPRRNLQVIETPEFMRGIYSVGGFNPAPPLEPRLGAFYWITPIPPDWPAARAESKLREYNFYKLKLLTIHEAIPGHYVQAEYANDVQPAGRRLLRSLFGNGPYVEGWAQYATEMTLDNGFLGNPPEMQLTFAKERLRVLANAILDVRLHTLGMTDDEAMDLMRRQTFQEAEEARGKLQRAKLSSAQLPMYYLGWRGWNQVRDGYRKAAGDRYKLSEFNDKALKEGAVSLPALGRLVRP